MLNNTKKPFVRIKKAAGMSAKKVWAVRGMALVFALIFIGIILFFMKYNPFSVFSAMVYGAFGKRLFIQETVKTSIPLLITALGVSLAFKMKVWNIGGEGQILVGGIAAAFVSLKLSDFMPQLPLVVLMGTAAFAAGGIYGMIPGICKAKWNTSETLLTLMMNYIALQWIVLLQNAPSWQDPNNTYPKIRMLQFNSRLPKLLGVHIGWIIALLLLVLFAVYTSKTKHGYEIMVVGNSKDTANYAGISVKKVIIRTMFLSASLCGLAGFLQVAGADGTLSEATAGGIGFTAITVAWLSNMNPVGMLICAIFISMLERGSDQIQTRFLIPQSFADVMIGIILLFIMGSEFFIRYKLVFRKGGGKP